MIELYEHNQIAYNAVVSQLAEAGRTTVIHPTGTGKSFIAFKLCEDNPDKTVCWISPSEYIFKTQLENLKSSGAEVPKNIKFYTYAKLMLMSQEELADIKPDLAVYDEFHRGGATEWYRGIKNLEALYPNLPTLGLSATAIRYLDNQRNMAEELFQNNVASEMTLGEAIVRGILNPPKYVLSLFYYQQDLEKYKKRIRYTRNKAVRDAAEKYLEALRRALEKAEGLDVIFDKHMTDRAGKYIVFCANKEHMDEMLEKSGEWFAKVDPEPHVYSVYANDPEVSSSFAEFKADNDQKHLKLLYCIDMLNEGIHMEDVAGVILLRPTVSPIIYKQQIGRALSASKQTDSVIFDVVMNIENLYSIDSVQEEMKDALSYYRALGEDTEIVNDQFTVVDEVHDCLELFEKLNDTLTASWEIMYGHAKQYFETYGNLEVPNRYITPDGYSLGGWIANQRNIRKGKMPGRLTEERIRKLDQIGMIWDGIFALYWDRNMAAAKQYYREHGTLNPPVSYVTADGIRLGAWLSGIRTVQKAGRLEPEKKEQLDRMGMVWDVLDYNWEKMYLAACDYYREYRNLDVPLQYVTKDGRHLGHWINRLRRLRRGTMKRGAPPTEEQIARLDQIGMIWEDSTLERKWNKAYQAAKAYAQIHHTIVSIPEHYPNDANINLRVWVVNQRKQYKQGRLPDGHKRLLDEIGMVWDLWEYRLDAVKKYYEEHHTWNIPQTFVIDSIWLGKWLQAQKKAYENGELTQEQRALFETLPLAELEKPDPWTAVYQDAAAYFKEHGNLTVPAKYAGESGTVLSTWLSNQRRKRKKGELTAEQIRSLDAIGLVWEPKSSWKCGYEHAQAYYKEHGNLEISQKYVCEDGYKLGQWVFSLRAAYRRKSGWKLTEEKIQKLDSLGMRWGRETVWERNYKKALQYLTEHDGALPSLKTAATEQEKEIATWLKSQRICARQNRLTTERMELLKRLDPMLLVPQRTPFATGYQNAKTYYAVKGNLDVPKSYQCENGYWLGSWVAKMRENKERLTEKQIHQLEQIGMIWEIESSWETFFHKAKSYFEKNGTLPLAPGQCADKEELHLCQWLKRQREKRRKGKLSEEQISRLQAIGMDFMDARQRAWQRGYEKAKEYYAEHGDLNVKVAYVCADGYRLGEWIHAQRQAYKENKLEEQQIALLNQCEMVWSVGTGQRNQQTAFQAYPADQGNLIQSKVG